MTLQRMRLKEQVTFNLNNNMYTATAFMDIEKDFDTTRHSGLLYKLSKLEFATTLMKLISSFFSQRRFSVSVEGAMSRPREIQAGVPQMSVLSLTLYNMYINNAPQTPGVHLSLFAVCIRQIAGSVLLSENSSAVSVQWRRDTFPADVDRPSSILQRMDETFHLLIV
jgi:hypothetical protein